MIFQHFWSRSISVGMAVLYIVLGLPLVLFPTAVGTFFVWALAAGCVVYAIPHMIRYVQARKLGQTLVGDLFLSVLPLLFSLFCLVRPHAILSFLPFVLGALLLMDGVGKLPMSIEIVRNRTSGRLFPLLSSLIPLVLGLILVFNPFQAARIVIVVFGVALIADGLGDLITALSLRSSQ